MEVDLGWRMERSSLWEDVQYELRPLKVWAFQELMDFWEMNGEKTDEGHSALHISPAKGIGLVEVARKIFPEHVRNLSGLTVIRDGSPCEAVVDALCEEAVLIPLTGEIISKLIALSEIKGEPEKN